MNFYIQQKVITFTDQFTVRDDWGNCIYTVRQQIFSWGKEYHILDQAGLEVAVLKEEVLHFLPCYQVIIGYEIIARIRKQLTFLSSRYILEGTDWQVCGNILDHDYEITDSLGVVAEIHRWWMSWGDCYRLSIAQGADDLLALCCVLAIDCVNEKSRNRQ